MPKGVYKRVKPVWNKGKKIGANPEHSKRMQGRPSWNKGLTKEDHPSISKMGFQEGHKFFKGGERGWIKKGDSEEKGLNWRGDDIGIGGVHKWVERHKGKAKEHKCADCGEQAIHWSNKKHDYKRNLDDYIARCNKCHRKYDKENNNNRLSNK